MDVVVFAMQLVWPSCLLSYVYSSYVRVGSVIFTGVAVDVSVHLTAV